MKKITLLLFLFICSCTYNEYYEPENYYEENCKQYVFTAGNQTSELWATPCGSKKEITMILQQRESTTLCISTNKGRDDKGLTGINSTIVYKRDCR